MSGPAKHIYEFGPFSLDATERQLLRGGEVVPLTPKLFDILFVLVENGGHILEKEELMKVVWPDSVVEEGNLTRNVSTLRKALGNSPNEQQYIETIPWRGYRFKASVREVGDVNDDLIVAKHSSARLVIEEERETSDEVGRISLGSTTRAKASFLKVSASFSSWHPPPRSLVSSWTTRRSKLQSVSDGINIPH